MNFLYVIFASFHEILFANVLRFQWTKSIPFAQLKRTLLFFFFSLTNNYRSSANERKQIRAHGWSMWSEWKRKTEKNYTQTQVYTQMQTANKWEEHSKNTRSTALVSCSLLSLALESGQQKAMLFYSSPSTNTVYLHFTFRRFDCGICDDQVHRMKSAGNLCVCLVRILIWSNSENHCHKHDHLKQRNKQQHQYQRQQRVIIRFTIEYHCVALFSDAQSTAGKVYRMKGPQNQNQNEMVWKFLRSIKQHSVCTTDS